MNDINKAFINKVKDIVYKILNKHNLLQGNWHLGKVDTVISSTKIKAFVDGSATSQLIAANPDVAFTVGDEIWIIFINNNQKDKYALCRRGI